MLRALLPPWDTRADGDGYMSQRGVAAGLVAAAGAMALMLWRVGAAVTVAIFGLRYRFIGFMLHPIGYAVGASSAPYLLWSSLFVAWAAKSVVIRAGGPRAYHGARPAFLGLVLGDYLMAGLWTVVGIATGDGYNFLPTPT